MFLGFEFFLLFLIISMFFLSKNYPKKIQSQKTVKENDLFFHAKYREIWRKNKTKNNKCIFLIFISGVNNIFFSRVSILL